MKKILVLILATMIVACAPAMKSKRVSLDEGDELASSITDKWIGKDTQNAIADISKQMEKHKGLQKLLAKFEAKGKKPKMFISEVQNQTSEAYFPIADMNDELLTEISQSGDFTLIDASARAKILKEISYQNDGMVDSNQAKSIGKSSGADLLMFGDVRMKPESLNGKTIKEYSVNLRLTDVETGEEVARFRFRSQKYSEQKSTSW
jgi:uncharacterized protein (TIGR02722 family)